MPQFDHEHPQFFRLRPLPKSHRWMLLMTSLVPIWPQTSTVLQVTPEALPKFHRQTKLMTSLVPIWPQTSTILQVTPEALPKFHTQTILMTSLVPIRPRISTIVQQVKPDPQANTFNDKSHPNSSTNIHISSDYAGGAQTPQTNTINDMVWCKQMWGKTVKRNILQVLLNVWFDKYLRWLSVNYT